ncbi:MAG: amidohydrolase [Candidatus Micrarchaeota archaeon]|nr:amidohydrolase [Candidatus Micrarchaeota archaeon]
MMMLDFHTHVGFDKDGMSHTIQELLATMDFNYVDKAVVFPLNEKDGDLIGASLKLLEAKNPRLVPFLRFDPKSTTPEMLRKHISRFRGVKLHPQSQDFDVMDNDFYPLYEIIAKSKKPLLVHTKADQRFPTADPDRISMLGDVFPNLKIILGHFAHGSPDAIARVGKLDNLYLETSIRCTHPLHLKRTLEIVGPDKILFGSDIPYSNQELELLKIRRCDITYEDMEKILYKNAASLLGL